MFSMARSTRSDVPALSCDNCGMPVLIVELAVVCYPNALFPNEVVHAQVLHKGACFDASELKTDHSQSHAQWMELSEYIQSFLDNSARLVRELAPEQRAAATISQMFAKR